MKKHFLAVLSPIALAVGCTPSNFAVQTTIETVRVMAVQSSEPYANPGDSITLTPLAYDGRADASVPMTFYWVPGVCANPANGAYYGCYDSLGPGFHAGEDVTDKLYVNPNAPADWSMPVTVPSDILAGTDKTSVGFKFGTMYAFFIACAGRVLYTPPASNGAPNANALTCVDSTGHPVSADDFVFGYAQVFSFAPVVLDGGVTIPITNTNPVIDALTWNGAPVDLDAGISVPHCTSSKDSACSGELNVIVPASSWELDQDDIEPNGTVGHEEIWVDFYMTKGTIAHGADEIYDPATGLFPDTTDKYTAADAGGAGILWAVVHDDRGGVGWVTMPVTAD